MVLPEDREVAVRPLPLRDILVARPSSRTAGSVSQTASPGRVSHRTRHKKINFLEMLKGDANNNTSVVDNSTSPGSVPEDEQCEGTSHDTSIVKEECVNKDKIARRKVHIKSAKITPALKGKDKVVVTKVKVKKEKDPVPEELSMGESECENLEEEDEEEDEDMVEKEKLPFFIGKRGAKSNDREQMAKKLKIMKSRKPGALKVKWKIFGKSNVAKEECLVKVITKMIRVRRYLVSCTKTWCQGTMDTNTVHRQAVCFWTSTIERTRAASAAVRVKNFCPWTCFSYTSTRLGAVANSCLSASLR